ncbi:MAG: preprotein translocase subunit SecY [Weeping tea tree witches'-broom phytoplasma]|uniref:preprotein translocase subunit SecY n=1 Tax=Candidatus Phytoplasma melaleucae TaxID=2982630 RepID=UPI00293A3C3F|nr:preprotein translocase subunit SecY [Weeping tea tree witches'-broom phytoplasma]
MKLLVDYFKDKKNVIKKIFFTLIIVLIYVIGINIYIPCIPPMILELAKLKRFVVQDFSIFNNPMPIYLLSLGVVPYITASIVMQLAHKVFPWMKEWNEHGEIGKYKINLVTKCLTLLIAIGQSLSLILRAGIFDIYFQKTLVIQVIFFLVVGTFICIWLSDLISSKGIGNGISLLIVISVSENLSRTLKYLFSNNNLLSLTQRLLIIFSFLILLILTIILCSSYLKIPINYATQQDHKKIKNYIPLKINTSGILPVILANTLLSVIPTIGAFFKPDSALRQLITKFQNSQYNYLGLGFFVYLLLILLFSVFSVFIMINPNDIADHLSKQDAYLEGVKPGEQTVYKLTQELFKVTIMGALSLTLLAAFPDLINFMVLKQLRISQSFNLGGTSLLIIVGVAIDIVQFISSGKTNVKRLYNKLF